VRVREKSNLIGPAIARLRYQRGWNQEDLVTKMQLLGCYMTRDILANIETRRSIATDKQIESFADVFNVEINELFPPRPARAKGHRHGRIIGIDADFVTRRNAHRGEDQT
jgi:transcriptional regulator with XRE-family HTH domain